MRLLDVDKLLSALRGNVLVDVTSELEKAISEQPTAYDVDKVVEQLKTCDEYIYQDEDDYDKLLGFDDAIFREDAIEIVQAGLEGGLVDDRRKEIG